MRTWLKQLRKEQGLTQEQVASGAFINRAYYSQIEQGVRNPSLDVAKGIADILGFNPSRFFVEDFNVPFEVALKNAPIIIAHCDLDLRYTWIYNPHSDYELKDILGKRDDEMASNPGIVELTKLKRRVIEEGITLKKIIRFPLSNGVHTYSIFAEPMTNENGDIIGVVTAGMEISDFD